MLQICGEEPELFHVQAFKIIVTDPDSVLNSLTREVKETGPDGQEVKLFLQSCAKFSIVDV